MPQPLLLRLARARFEDHASQMVHFVPDPELHSGSYIHILSAMKQIEFVPKEATNEMVIYKARELNPEFPGIIDFSCWEIGRNWCKPGVPLCGECIVEGECEKRL